MPITRATITDDDGSGTTGDVADAAFMTGLYDAIDVSVNADWVIPTFNAAHFSGGSGTWTVDAGDVGGLSWRRLGNTVSVTFALNTTSIAGATNALQIGNGQWGGGTIAKLAYNSLAWLANAGTLYAGYVYAGAGNTFLGLVRADTGNFTAGANSTYVFGQITFEVNP